jgi:hypothetical protein
VQRSLILAMALMACHREPAGIAVDPAGSASSKPAASSGTVEGKLCREVTIVEANGRLRVTVGVGGAVLAAHEARFRALGIEPNGEAWAGVVEQCAKATLPKSAELDPEAGSLAIWVPTRADADTTRAVLCRALDDSAWLNQCLKTIDRSKLDD